MYVLDAGRLKKRISIYGYQEVTDDLGQKSTRIVKKASVWAEIKPVRGMEFLEYYRDANELQYKITVRYRKGLKEKDVIVRGKTQYEINSIIDIDEEHIALEIYCTESKDKKIPEMETADE